MKINLEKILNGHNHDFYQCLIDSETIRPEKINKFINDYIREMLDQTKSGKFTKGGAFTEIEACIVKDIHKKVVDAVSKTLGYSAQALEPFKSRK